MWRQQPRDGRFCVRCSGRSARRRWRGRPRRLPGRRRSRARAVPRGTGQHPHHEARDDPRQAALAVPQDPHRRGHRRARRADHRRARADVRRRRSRRSSRTWSARTRGASSTTGRRSTGTRSIAAARSSPARCRASTRRCGTSRARRSACRSTNCSGGPTRDRVRVYAHARTIDAVKQQKAQGFTAFKTGPYLSRRGADGTRGWARFVETPGFVKKAADNFAELREAVGRRRRHRHRLPRRDQPGDGQAAHQGHRALSADVRRGAGQLPERRRDGRHRARHAPADRDRRAHLHQVGLPRDPREAGRRDPAARPLPRRRHHRVPPHRRHGRGATTRPSRRTIRSARSRWRPACSSPRRSRTSCARSR